MDSTKDRLDSTFHTESGAYLEALFSLFGHANQRLHTMSRIGGVATSDTARMASDADLFAEHAKEFDLFGSMVGQLGASDNIEWNEVKDPRAIEVARWKRLASMRTFFAQAKHYVSETENRIQTRQFIRSGESADEDLHPNALHVMEE